MKQKLTPLMLSLCLLGAVSVPVFAATTNDISTRTQTLEQQVTELQQEVTSLKKELKANPTRTKSTSRKKSVKTHRNVQSPQDDTIPGNRATTGVQQPETTHVETPQIKGPNSLPSSLTSATYLPIDLDVPGQSFVSSGPYLGVPLEYNGSNLIINSPSVNEDVSLLRMRKNINDRLTALGETNVEDKSHLLLSGIVEGQGIYISQGNNSSSSDIDLTSANLDAYILGPSNWTSGLIEFAYDNNIGAQEGSLFNNAREENSRVFVNKAFIIIGNLAQSPFYGTVGQMYVPFGTYSTAFVSPTLPQELARTKARAINIGYQPLSSNSPYAAAYIFRGDSHGSATERVNNGGINLGLRLTQGKFGEDIGAGVIGNIADAGGMQNTGGQTSSVFGGFGATGTCTIQNADGTTTTGACGNEHLVHRVPAYDLRGNFTFGDTIDVVAEYIHASTQFNPNDLSYNSHGAQPEAFHVEGSYSFQAVQRPTSIGIGYDMTSNALALGLPAKRWGVVLNTSIWRNTLESLEFKHDINYSASAYATGSQVTPLVTVPAVVGRSDNTVTAQMDLYF